MDAPWNRRGPGGKGPADRQRKRRSRRHTIEFMTLEDRRLQAVASITEVVTPNILTPNNGRGVNVTVSGKVEQVLTLALPATQQTQPPTDEYNADIAINDAKPIPYEVLGIVTDQYRQIEPRVTTTVDPVPTTGGKSFYRPTPKGAPPTEIPPSVVTVRYFHLLVHRQAPGQGQRDRTRQYDISVFGNDLRGGRPEHRVRVRPARASEGREGPESLTFFYARRASGL